MRSNWYKLFEISSLCLALLLSTLSAIGQDSQARVISGTKFKIDSIDQAAGIYGDVVVEVDVSKDGSVKRARVIVGPGRPCGTDLSARVAEINRSIASSVELFKFEPAKKNGKPVSTTVGVTIPYPRNEPGSVSNSPSSADGSETIIKGGVLNGKATILPKPDYPAAARANRVFGKVDVNILIDEKGNVIWAQTLFGLPILLAGSRGSACGGKFPPSLINGVPVKVEGILTYNYVPRP